MKTLYEIWVDYTKDTSCEKRAKELADKMRQLCDYILAKYNIFKGDEGHEDLHQEAYILLFDLVTRYDKELGKLENYFLSAFRKVVYKWKVDCCRDAHLRDTIDLTEDVMDNVLANDFDNRLQECLSTQESHIYCLFLKKGITDTAVIAELCTFEDAGNRVETERKVKDIIVRIQDKAMEINKE